MPKLNAQIRREILGNLVRHAFLERYERREADMIRLAAAVYEEALPVPARRLVDSLPEGWLREDENMPVRFGGQRGRVSFSGDLTWVVHYKRRVDCAPRFTPANHLGRSSSLATRENRLEARRRLPECFRADGDETLSLPAGHPLSTQWHQLQSSVDKLLEEANTAATEAWRALMAATTAEKLTEAWPESAPHIPASTWSAAAKSRVPAIRTEDLNKSLRLP